MLANIVKLLSVKIILICILLRDYHQGTFLHMLLLLSFLNLFQGYSDSGSAGSAPTGRQPAALSFPSSPLSWASLQSIMGLPCNLLEARLSFHISLYLFFVCEPFFFIFGETHCWDLVNMLQIAPWLFIAASFCSRFTHLLLNGLMRVNQTGKASPAPNL